MVLETQRLELSEFTADDASFILRLLNEPSFLKYIGDRGVRTLDDARAYIERVPREGYRRFGFAPYRVQLKSGQTPIGMCGLMQKPWLEHPDIAYAFVPEAGAQGYAYEAASAVLQYGRATLKMTRIVAVVQPDNARSIRLLEKLGFSYEQMVTDPHEGAPLMRFASMP